MGVCLHITTETANPALALQAAGVELMLYASNPHSTREDVAAALVVDHDIPAFAIRGDRRFHRHRHRRQACRTKRI